MPQGRKELLYPVNSKKTDRETEILAYITWFEKFDPKTEYIEKAGKLISEKETDDKILIHFWYANAAWDKITSYAPKISAGEKDAWTHYRVAKAFDRIGSLEKSLDWYKKATNLMPLNTDFQVEYANALIRNQQMLEAQNVLKKILEIQPKNVLALANAGAAYSDQPALAVQYLKKAIALNPDVENARLYLAEIYIKSGLFNEAKWQLQEALRIQPNNSQAKKLFAEMSKH